MVEKGLHRVPIVEKDEKLANLISRSSVVNYIWQNKFVWEKELGAKTMSELNLHNINPHHGGTALLTVKDTSTALAAFKLLHEKHASGVPVVDENNKLVANISVQDLKVRKYSQNQYIKNVLLIYIFIMIL